MSGRVETAVDGPLGFLLFDHPARKNAITFDMWRAIPPAVEELAEDAAVRVIVVRGTGRDAFVSGADISEFGRFRSGSAARRYDAANAEAFAALSSCPKPLIAMIHGPCVGGGLAIALLADLRYAAEDAVFALPPARLGLGYSANGIESLVQTVGESVAKEIFFTARRFSAQEALSRRLVNEVFSADDLEPAVLRTALTVAKNAPLTIRSAKLVMREIRRPPSERNDSAIEQSIAACYSSEDYQEGVNAFLEKRAPVFKGS